MAQQSRKRKARKRKGKIRFSSRAQLVNKNDATRVAKPAIVGTRKIQGRPPADVGVTFRVKIRKK